MFYSLQKVERRRNLRRTADKDIGADTATSTEESSAPVQLRSIQLSALARFCSFIAGANAVSALLGVYALIGTVPLQALLPWALIVMMVSLHMRRSIIALYDECLGRAVLPREIRSATLKIILCAAAWVTIPAYGFLDAPLHSAIIILMLSCALISAAFVIAVAPAAALGWSAILAFVVALAWHPDAIAMSLGIRLTVLFYLAIIVAGTLVTARMAARQVMETASDQERAQKVSMLVKEYEDNGSSGLWQIDTHNHLTYVSPNVAISLGRSKSQLIGYSLPALLGGNAELGGAIVSRSAFTDMLIEVKGGARSTWLSFTGSPIFDSSGIYRGFRGTALDVTASKTSEEKLREIASLDVLTGLPNRLHLTQLLGDVLKRCDLEGRSCALLCLDLDGFKPVNDTFGHAKGDLVLRSVAARLVQEVGAEGTAARLGGDEFVILVPVGSRSRAIEDLAERVIKRISQPYLLDSVEVRIGVSIGIAFSGVDASTPDELIKYADLALYDAKDAGRGTFKFFEARLQKNAQDRIMLEADLRKAIVNKELHLRYQPVVCADTRRVVSFEALLRWHHPTHGSVSPATFIPIAEEAGLIGEIGTWVLRTACRDAATWPMEVSVAVNLSCLQLQLASLPATVRDALKDAKLPPNRLELEVTESVFLGQSGQELDVLKRLRDMGVSIALDDFGTGYSSLGYLNKALFDKLKIDGSFVRAAGKDPEMVAIIQAIVTLARCFRMKITAEGVETQNDYARMKELGCDLIQGYLFGRPLPFEHTAELVGRPSIAVAA